MRSRWFTARYRTGSVSRNRYTYLAPPGVIAFAHRGGAGDWPENTWPAFDHAVRLGYRYLETDVHATSDGRLLAFHDAVLDRVTTGSGPVARLPWSVVKHARVAGTHEIVQLEDLLGSLPDAFVNIDAKHDNVIEPLVRAIERTAAHGRVCIASFSDKRLAALRARLGERVCTSAGPKAVAALRLKSIGMRVSVPAIACVQVPISMRGVPVVDRRFVDAAHASGAAVHVWTVDDPQTMHRLIDLGVDGIMTDRPSVLRAVLEARGLWPA